MDASGESRFAELRRRQRPRIAALVARIDAGEREAFRQLEDRLSEDCRDLEREGKRDLVEAIWGWLRARIEELNEAEEYAALGYAALGYTLDAEAPARWRGLRVRVSYVAGGGLARPTEVVGRLQRASERGIHVLIDELEEERDGVAQNLAGSIARRVKAERFVAWPAVLSVQPLPIREVYAVSKSVRPHEEAAAWERESGDGKEVQVRANSAEEGLGEGYATLGRFVRAQRRFRGWSMRELADASGLNLDTIANVERAHHRPRIASLERLAHALVSAFAEPESPRPGVLADEYAEPGAEDGDRLAR